MTTKRKPRRVLRSLLALGLAALAAAAAAFWMRGRLLLPYRGYSGEEQIVDIAPGTKVPQILQQLETAGVIADARLARLWLIERMHSPVLRAGEYRFQTPLTTPEVLAKLARGEVMTHPVTLVEGLTLEETIAQIVKSGFGKIEALRLAAHDASSIHDLDAAANDLEGYLFPDTYEFARGASEHDIVSALVKNFRHRSDETLKQALAAHPDWTARRILTLASIVEKEARQDIERPIIAGVYANRLRIGMGLYADPTVVYALERRGTYDGNIHKADLQVDDPYNTYRYPGLPPGPICSPGLGSLRAAAAPADVPYLYFVSRNDGTHAFATTLSEHNRNVEVFQKQYWRDRWRAEKKSSR